jgi:hypothetical protein
LVAMQYPKYAYCKSASLTFLDLRNSILEVCAFAFLGCVVGAENRALLQRCLRIRANLIFGGNIKYQPPNVGAANKGAPENHPKVFNISPTVSFEC